ncbi:MAG: hypothetical protein H6611_00915 [Ignavibacteriales bacterium]|nr:hypothetical protein [Ignavibacteriales bacterium]
MNSSFIEINHNSIQSFGASYSNSRVFELDYKNIYTGTLENLNIYNNIFNNIQDGYAYYTDGGSNISSNYNNLFTTGEYIGFADGTDTPLLTDFRNASGTDANSYMATVNFFSNADLHIVSTSESIMGVAVSGITKDIDGNTRNDPPF